MEGFLFILMSLLSVAYSGEIKDYHRYDDENADDYHDTVQPFLVFGIE